MAATFREGRIEDSREVFDVFREALLDLGLRSGVMAITGGEDPDVLARLWDERRPLFEHLARTNDEFWVAEDGGRIAGYARSTLREDVRQLTELYVRPSLQSVGLGRELLRRAFPREGAKRRLVVASTDARAIKRYLRAGASACGIVAHFSRKAEFMTMRSPLHAEPISAVPQTIEAFGAIDKQVLGFRRDTDHEFLLTNRQGFLFSREGRPVGYGYVGKRSGPFAALHAADLRGMLSYAENEAAARGIEFGLEVPLTNSVVVSHLLERDFHMEAFFEVLMTDGDFGRFENYVFSSPPFFL
jgi:ribosomal protein S18 acetylase RimI-like enzyme